MKERKKAIPQLPKSAVVVAASLLATEQPPPALNKSHE